MSRSSNRTMLNAVDSYEELFALLGEDEDRAARHYLVLRAKLITYFEGRRISPAEDYADEVLHRTAAKIGSGEKIENIDRYIYGIARFVRLESYRKAETEIIEEDHRGFDARASRVPGALTVAPRQHDREEGSESVMQECLCECLAKLDEDKQRLMLAYYEADEASGRHIEHRRRLAKQHGKSAGALQKQICVLRQKVSSCTKECVRRELGEKFRMER